MKARVDWLWLYLSPSGRLTRWPYVLASMLISVISSYFVYRHVLAYMPANAADPLATPGLNDLLFLIYAVSLWPMIALSAKRVQDLGISPFVGAVIALPAISMLAYFVLALVPGNAEANRYGAERNVPPPKRGKS